jgi:hypothetical protein
MNINSIDDYRQFDPHTDPGKYSYLYQDLPRSLDTLCTLVQNQLVHPWNGGQQPQGRHYQPRNNYHVQDILEQLLDLNQLGLFVDRPAQDRVLACCRENALLLSSILKFQGVPSRVRAGWVCYVSSDPTKFADHWLSEIWLENEHRWLLVDTNPKRIDLPHHEFQSGGQAWLQIRSGQATSAQYRSADDLFYVKLNFGHDFNAILGTGPHYWEAPPLFHIKMEEMADWHLALLDKIAHLLEEPDRNLSILQGLQRKYEELQGQMSAWPIFAQTVYN